MLIENIEQELDPLLDPVLERRFQRRGRSVTVQLADKEARILSPLPSAVCLKKSKRMNTIYHVRNRALAAA
jgi:hypothetical protein